MFQTYPTNQVVSTFGHTDRTFYVSYQIDVSLGPSEENITYTYNYNQYHLHLISL